MGSTHLQWPLNNRQNVWKILIFGILDKFVFQNCSGSISAQKLKVFQKKKSELVNFSRIYSVDSTLVILLIDFNKTIQMMPLIFVNDLSANVTLNLLKISITSETHTTEIFIIDTVLLIKKNVGQTIEDRFQEMVDRKKN